MTNKQVALLEAVLSVGSAYVAIKSEDTASKYVATVSSVYLAAGCYLNLQGRVKMLEKDDPNTKSKNFLLTEKKGS